MSKRHNRAVAPIPARAHDGMDRLSILTTRANLLWLADRQRDVAAREASTGRALTGMPVHRSTEPRLPGVLNGPDLSGDIARTLDGLVRELMDAVPDWQPDTHETKRWKDAASRVEQVCATPQDALAWWDTAADLRARTERTLGPAAAGRFMGWCAVPACPGEIRLADDQDAAVCPDCGGFVTRAQQTEYVVQALAERLMTLSELATALVTVGAEVPYRTLQTWARRGQITEHEDGSGLYPFEQAFTRAARRATRVAVSGSAA